jgi:hypothetical protein
VLHVKHQPRQVFSLAGLLRLHVPTISPTMPAQSEEGVGPTLKAW